MAKQRIINGDLTRNLTLKGEDLIVHGNIAAGVKVNVTGGGVKVDKNVLDGAQIIQRGGNSVYGYSGGNSTSGDNSPIIIGSTVGNVVIDGNNVIVDGRPLKSNSSGLSGIDIRGLAGNRVLLDSANSLHAAGVGHDSIIKAKNGVDVGNVGANTSIRAGNSIEALRVGENATLVAGNSIDTTCVATGVSIDAGNGVKAPRCTVKAPRQK